MGAQVGALDEWGNVGNVGNGMNVVYTPSYYTPYPPLYNKRPYVFCANCGGCGHVYKTCNHPVISYGIICYKTFYDAETNSVYPKYLMVQRRDSLSYVEFLRGKYKLNNKDYIMTLLSNMTVDEREKLRSSTFEEIWSSMWNKPQSELQENQSKNFNKEWRESGTKFNSLKKGYYIMTKDQEKVFVSLNILLDKTTSQYTETEWGFPKGRRNINEDDMNCAMREFREETGVPMTRIRVSRDIKPIEEVFTGTNQVRYKHVYYVAKYYTSPSSSSSLRRTGSSRNSLDVTQLDKLDKVDKIDKIDMTQLYDPENTQQAKEVRDVQWFTYAEAQERIRDHNVERKEMFKRLNQFIMKSIIHR
jgi:ADP-ribose pyrophosphatase YjhB (NUDIX family)